MGTTNEMAAKKILLIFDADRYTFPLTEFLIANAKPFGWKIKVGTLLAARASDRIRKASFAGTVEFVDFKKMQECDQAIRKSDLVVAIATDASMLQIADSCIQHKRTLISPMRLTRQMALKKPLAKENNVLIMMDCGFSPGLDHIIAKKAIDNIHSRGGVISSFKTYSGTYVSQIAEQNPWSFRLTEPASDVLNWGKHNNRHILNGRMQHVPYHRLFERSQPMTIQDLAGFKAIPEGDSVYYRKIYDLVEAHTVIKGKLLRNGFDRTWDILVKTGFTDSVLKMDFAQGGSYYNVLDSLLPPSDASIEERLQRYTGADDNDIEKLRWLGLFNTSAWNEMTGETTPALVLQHLLETKFAIQPGDRDSAIMQHELGYELREDHFEMTATLTLHGDDETNSAMAKVIGYTSGAAAKAVLLGSITLKGLHIPILREIYDPILNELEELGLAFQMTERKFPASVNSEV